MRLTNEFNEFNPLRKPDWRFRRVQDLVRSRKRCTRRDDEYIRRMLGFYLGWMSMEVDRDKLLFHEPAIYYAMCLHTESLRHPHVTTLLQAKLLAGVDDKKTAQDLDMLPEAVKTYEAIFFEVREHLQKPGWIFQQVIVPAMAHKERSPTPSCLDGSLLLAGYLGGPVLLDQLIGSLKSGVADRIDAFLEATVKRRAAMAAADVEVDSKKVDSLFHLYSHLQERTSRGSDQLSMMEKHIEAFLGKVNEAYNIGGPLDAKLAPTPLGELDNLNAELRDDELMQAARGERPAAADEIKDLTIRAAGARQTPRRE